MTAQIKVKVQRKALVKLKVLPKFSMSVAAGAGITVVKVGGVYTISTGAGGAFTDVTIGGTTTLTGMTPGSVLFAGASSVLSQDNANLFWDDTNNRLGIGTVAPTAKVSVKPPVSTAEQGIYVEQIASGSPTDTNVFGYSLNHFYGLGTALNAANYAAKITNGLLVDVYPRTGSKSNVVGITGAVLIPDTSVIDTSDASLLDYVGLLGYSSINVTLGGSAPTTAGGKGGGFGIHGFVNAGPNATNLVGITNEFDVFAQAGSSMSRRSGIAIVDSNSAVQGNEYDAGLSIAAAGASPVRFQNGVLFSDYNGKHGVHASGKLIATQGAHTVAYGIDLSSYTFSASAFKSTGIDIAGTGATAITSTSATALAVGASANPAFSVDASVASQATGVTITGSAAGNPAGISARSSGTNESLSLNSKGSGNLILNNVATGQVLFGQRAAPLSNDGAALGSGTLSWSDLFLATGGVLNWNNGQLTATHSGTTLAINGGITLGTALPVASGGSGVTAMPAFSVHRNGTDQTAVVTATPTKVQFTTERFDTNNNFDNATNYRFTPTVAGKYLVTFAWECVGTGAGTWAMIYKSGALIHQANMNANVSGAAPNVSAVVDMNGSTDYIEFYAYHEHGGNRDIKGLSQCTWATGSRISA